VFASFSSDSESTYTVVTWRYSVSLSN
jgi:hypothetical protein